MPSPVGIEIHARLDRGEPPAFVARETGRKLAAVYFHRARRCQCPGDASPVPVPAVDGLPETPASRDPAAVILAAHVAGLSADSIGRALGIETINPDVEDFGIGDAQLSQARLAALETEAEALVKMRGQHPGQWATLMSKQAEIERKTRERGEVVMTQADFAQFVRHLMRRIEVTFLGPVRDKIRDGWDLQLYVHELIAAQFSHMMLASSDDRHMQVLLWWPGDAPGMRTSWEVATDGMDRCGKGCGSLGLWVLEGRTYCDICVLEKLWKNGVVDNIHEGPVRPRSRLPGQNHLQLSRRGNHRLYVLRDERGFYNGGAEPESECLGRQSPVCPVRPVVARN